MAFVAIVSIIFELIALIGAIRESLIITLTILIVMIVGTASGLVTIKSIDLCTVATQMLFILLAAIYVVLLKKNLMRDNDPPADLEMNRNGDKTRSEKYSIK